MTLTNDYKLVYEKIQTMLEINAQVKQELEQLLDLIKTTSQVEHANVFKIGDRVYVTHNECEACEPYTGIIVGLSDNDVFFNVKAIKDNRVKLLPYSSFRQIGRAHV